ncbi:ABC transporter substrate-binding protein [Hoeflea prorocentri]|uniref:Polyamine ABC transporter substrate-binding protein n=1 Tax=Hoeflea prorocentri TaxID=1922333 RepID=A0A9X3UN71_9HYPH|nr:polyamine ABC transporter substrate-binding protein [Hoeflea prorocentri]MCY6383480.1 polyamine ABC transporter substrate-binding protein [Hoeflea prorocentri]MDA5401280.1 polyamine ABC transporter substrate-binding protein [Hoeflea prorocentri]
MLSAGVANAKETFTISWWGYNGEKLDANIIQPFLKMCDCEVVFETGNNADRLNKLAVRRGEGVDVIFLTDSFSQIGVEQGLFQPVDRAKIPNVEKLYDLAKAPQGEYGPAYSIGRVSIVYDSEKVDPITSWDDLWREDLAGTVSLPGITTTAGPMMVLRAAAHAGVDAYTDPDGAFAAIEELKPNIVKNYNTGSEMVNLISTGEATVAVAQDFTFASLMEAVPSMVEAELSDGGIATLNTINIPTGAKQVDLAHKFINFVLSTEVQTIEAKQGVDAPVNTEVVLTEEEAANWTYGEDEIAALNRIDYGKLNAAKTEWIDRWNEIFGL